jgi:hypothetical protein
MRVSASASAPARAQRIAALRPTYWLGGGAPLDNGVDTMKATQWLHDPGQSIWLDTVGCCLLTIGTPEKLKQGLPGEALFLDQAHTLPDATLKAPGEHPLQDEGAKAFLKSWHELMDVIGFKSAALAKVS